MDFSLPFILYQSAFEIQFNPNFLNFIHYLSYFEKVLV